MNSTKMLNFYHNNYKDNVYIQNSVQIWSSSIEMRDTNNDNLVYLNINNKFQCYTFFGLYVFFISRMRLCYKLIFCNKINTIYKPCICFQIIFVLPFQRSVFDEMKLFFCESIEIFEYFEFIFLRLIVYVFSLNFIIFYFLNNFFVELLKLFTITLLIFLFLLMFISFLLFYIAMFICFLLVIVYLWCNFTEYFFSLLFYIFFC